MSWSRHGYEKASYCISHTGRKPAMHRPTAVPRIPASASGVSTHRSGPKRSRRPAVARKTPPARPTSSPMTSTDSSRSISSCSASLMASTSVFSAILQPFVGIGVRVPEDELGVGLGKCLRGRDAASHRLTGLFGDLLHEAVVEDAEAAEVALEAADALVPALE